MIEQWYKNQACRYQKNSNIQLKLPYASWPAKAFTTDFHDAIAAGEIVLQGQQQELARFLGYFEPPGASPVSLTLH